MLIGAAAQSLPDIDFIASFWLDPTDDLLAHRGITHSFLFGLTASFILGIIALRTHRGYSISIKQWIIFFLAEIGTHLFLDAFNNYGVGWLEPFSHYRISFNTIFVLDPFYTTWLVVAFVMLLILPRTNGKRHVWICCGLTISSLYLGYGLYHKYSIDKLVRKNMTEQHLSGPLYFSTPTVFNNWLWYIVVNDSSDFLVGYHSVFDREEKISFHRFPKNELLLDPLRDQKDVRALTRFSQNFFTIENQHDTLVFNDLRFGQIAGWSNPEASFVFHYYLNHPHANSLIVQRGRFEGWNAKTIEDLITRIKGH
jgi:inner membrane protein